MRLLSSLETEKAKLLQILLVGQPNLRNTIASPRLEQFRKRIAVSYHLLPLDRANTAAYINYRLKLAALGPPLQFPADVAALIHLVSGRIPRTINVICDAALVFGYAEERHQIDFRLLQEVLGELETTGILPAASGTQAPPALMPDATTHAVPVHAAPARAAEPVAVLTAAVQEQLVARAADDEAVRSTLLDQRELALAQRERELAEQRQVLLEEYRLLRTQRAHAVPGSGSAGVRLNPQRESNAERFPSARHDGVRGWLQRVLSGASHRPAEGS